MPCASFFIFISMKYLVYLETFGSSVCLTSCTACVCNNEWPTSGPPLVNWAQLSLKTFPNSKIKFFLPTSDLNQTFIHQHPPQFNLKIPKNFAELFHSVVICWHLNVSYVSCLLSLSIIVLVYMRCMCSFPRVESIFATNLFCFWSVT